MNDSGGGRCSSETAEDAAVAAAAAADAVGGGGAVVGEGGVGGVGGADSHASDALSLLDALGGESLPEKERRLSQEIAKLQKLRQQLLAQHATAASPDYADNSQRVSLPPLLVIIHCVRAAMYRPTLPLTHTHTH